MKNIALLESNGISKALKASHTFLTPIPSPLSNGGLNNLYTYKGLRSEHEITGYYLTNSNSNSSKYCFFRNNPKWSS